EKENRNQHCSYSSNTAPDGIGCTQRQGLAGFYQQPHTHRYANDKTKIPQPHFYARSFFGFTDTKSKKHFKQSAKNQSYPVHFYFFIIKSYWLLAFSITSITLIC